MSDKPRETLTPKEARERILAQGSLVDVIVTGYVDLKGLTLRRLFIRDCDIQGDLDLGMGSVGSEVEEEALVLQDTTFQDQVILIGTSVVGDLIINNCTFPELHATDLGHSGRLMLAGVSIEYIECDAAYARRFHYAAPTTSIVVNLEADEDF